MCILSALKGRFSAAFLWGGLLARGMRDGGDGVSCDWTSIPPVDLVVRRAVNGAPTHWFLQFGVSVSRSWKSLQDAGSAGGNSQHACWSQQLRFRVPHDAQAPKELHEMAPLALVQLGNVSTVIGGALDGFLPWTLHKALVHSTGSWRMFHMPCFWSVGTVNQAAVIVTERVAKSDGMIRHIHLARSCDGWTHMAVNIAAVPHIS